MTKSFKRVCCLILAFLTIVVIGLSIALAVILTHTKDEEKIDPEYDTSGYTMISNAVTDALLDIRYYSTFNFVGKRIFGYNQPVALLTKQAAHSLYLASVYISQLGLRFRIFNAYCPQSAVDHFVSWANDPADTKMKSYFYSDKDKAVLISQGYIQSRVPHTRGSTVDLTLFNLTTQSDLDMGGTYNLFSERSHFDYASDLTETQISNRQLLRKVMTDHGFVGDTTKWWQFTLVNEPYPNMYFKFPVSTI